MTIDNKNNFIYIHIPKAAGTTITKFLTSNVASAKKINTRGDTHHGISTFIKDGNVIKPLDEYFKFTTVRNPWDWYVSLYEYTKKGKCHEWRLYKENGNPDFKTWLKRIVNATTTDTTLIQFKKDRTSTATHYKYLKNSNLDCGWFTHRYIYSVSLDWEDIFENGNVDDFFQNEEKYNVLDAVYKTEELKSGDFSEKFLWTLKLDGKFRQYKKQNITPNKKNYRDYYDEESKLWVAEKERGLIKKFNYEF